MNKNRKTYNKSIWHRATHNYSSRIRKALRFICITVTCVWLGAQMLYTCVTSGSSTAGIIYILLTIVIYGYAMYCVADHSDL